MTDNKIIKKIIRRIHNTFMIFETPMSRNNRANDFYINLNQKNLK